MQQVVNATSESCAAACANQPDVSRGIILLLVARSTSSPKASTNLSTYVTISGRCNVNCKIDNLSILPILEDSLKDVRKREEEITESSPRMRPNVDRSIMIQHRSSLIEGGGAASVLPPAKPVVAACVINLFTPSPKKSQRKRQASANFPPGAQQRKHGQST